MSGKKGSASRRKSTLSASPMPQLSDDIIQEIMNRTIDGSHTGLAKNLNQMILVLRDLAIPELLTLSMTQSYRLSQNLNQMILVLRDLAIPELLTLSMPVEKT
eukprot:gene12024-15126_t